MQAALVRCREGTERGWGQQLDPVSRPFPFPKLGGRDQRPFLASCSEEDSGCPGSALGSGRWAPLSRGSSRSSAHSHPADPGPTAEPWHCWPLQGTGGHAAQVGRLVYVRRWSACWFLQPASLLPSLQGRPLLNRLLPPVCQPQSAGPPIFRGEVTFLCVLPGGLRGWKRSRCGCQPL